MKLKLFNRPHQKLLKRNANSTSAQILSICICQTITKMANIPSMTAPFRKHAQKVTPTPTVKETA